MSRDEGLPALVGERRRRWDGRQHRRAGGDRVDGELLPLLPLGGLGLGEGRQPSLLQAGEKVTRHRGLVEDEALRPVESGGRLFDDVSDGEVAAAHLARLPLEISQIVNHAKQKAQHGKTRVRLR
ncbi:MAG: hypothetical protein GY740_00025 [Gammaproteobacteria bacterium]|nr:hypothetical protein [Gammaproteobacteria bacterium]